MIIQVFLNTHCREETMSSKFGFFTQFVTGFFLATLFSLSFAESVAPAQLISEAEQQQHIEKMKGMTQAEKNQYRNEQYASLRAKAASIGYAMPETPPWAETKKQTGKVTQAEAETKPLIKSTKSNASSAHKIVQPEVKPIGGRHQNQLEKYRQAAAEKREEMQDRLEKQRQSVRDRIARLVEENAVKPAPEAPRFTPPMPPPRFTPTVPMYPRYYYAPQPAYRY